MALEGSERKVLHAILREQGEARLVTSMTPKSLRSPICPSKRSETVWRLSKRKSAFSGPSGWVVTAPISRRKADRNSDGRRSSSVRREPRAHSRSSRRAFGHLMPRTKTSSSNWFPVLVVATGSPRAVHFWKVRIEEMDPDKTFAGGLHLRPERLRQVVAGQSRLAPSSFRSHHLHLPGGDRPGH